MGSLCRLPAAPWGARRVRGAGQEADPPRLSFPRPQGWQHPRGPAGPPATGQGHWHGAQPAAPSHGRTQECRGKPAASPGSPRQAWAGCQVHYSWSASLPSTQSPCCKPRGAGRAQRDTLLESWAGPASGQTAPSANLYFGTLAPAASPGSSPPHCPWTLLPLPTWPELHSMASHPGPPCP